MDEKKHQNILSVWKKDMPRKKERNGKKMNPLSLFKPFSSILEEIVKYWIMQENMSNIDKNEPSIAVSSFNQPLDSSTY